MGFTLKWVFVTLIVYELLSYSQSQSPGSFVQSDVDIYIPSISAPKPGWIDPFDMIGESRSRGSLFVQSDVEIDMLQKRCSNHEMYLRRFVNLFLSSVELRDKPVSDESAILINLEFLINGKDINILRNFGQGKNDAPKVEFVSDALERIFSQKTPQNRNISIFSDFVTWFQNTTLKILRSPEWTVLSSVVFMLVLTLWFIYKTHSYGLAVYAVLFTIFLAGFGFTWIRMYEEKEVERYVNNEIHGTVPKHCSSQAQFMAWYEHMFYRMFGADCYEFYKARDVRPIVKISPADVLGETVSSMIIKPASNLGKAYGNFISSVMGSLPWWLLPVALPLAFILPVVFTVILLAFLFNYRLSLSITGFHLMPSWSSSLQSDVTKDRYVEDCSHRKSNSQSNSTVDSILASDKPLFVMNWMGLKKLSSSTLLKEKDTQNQNEEEKGILEKDDHSLKGENEKMSEDLKEFEDFVELLEEQKIIESVRRRRSIHTCTDAENTLNVGRSDLPKIEYIDLPSGSGKSSRASVNTDNENCI